MERTFYIQDLKQTRFYQEAKEEARLKVKLGFVPRLLEFGLTVEQITQVLNLEVAQVEQARQKPNNQNDEYRGD